MTIAELIAQFCAETAGELSPAEANRYRQASRALEPYREWPLERFGPNALRELRRRLAASHAAATVRAYVGHVVALYRWAVAHEIIPHELYARLRALEPLKGPPPDPVRPVPEATLTLTLAVLTPELRDIATLQLLTGSRPGEILALTADQLDMRGEIWTYTPTHHKTQWAGRRRTIAIGPRAQAIIAARLDRPTNARLFGYTPASYRRAIARVCRRMDVPPWSPNQLRHNYATTIRAAYGLEAAQIALGHASPAVTDAVYAERDARQLARIARETG